MDTLEGLASENPDNQGQIAKKLVGLIGVRGAAAAGVARATPQRAAHALWELARHHRSAPLRIVNAGAIAPLVELLGHGVTAAKDQAMGALFCLADKEPSNQLAIATGRHQAPTEPSEP